MAITAIAFLFLLKRKNLSVQSSIKDKLLKNTNNKLPEIEKLLELEKLAIRMVMNLIQFTYRRLEIHICIEKNNDYKDIVFNIFLETSPLP